jgi:type II secretory pathway component PulC
MANARKTRNKARPSAAEAPHAAEVIVARALMRPDLGPQRLALLLEGEGLEVSKSTVYQVLRRRGLQTRERRRQFAAPADAPKADAAAVEAAAPSERTGLAPSPAPEPEQAAAGAAPPAEPPAFGSEDLPAQTEGHLERAAAAAPATLHPRPPHIHAGGETGIGKGRWVFRIANLLLAGLAVLLAAQIGTTLHDALRSRPARADAPPVVQERPALQAAAEVTTNTSLQAYHVIVERNLFGTARKPTSDEVNEAAELAKINLVGSELGLKLIGTTVAADRRLNQAVIESARPRTQEIYRERERAGKVLIKRILRNNVIVATERGEQRLTVDYENVKAPATTPPAAPPALSAYAQPDTPPGARLPAADEAPSAEAPEIHFSMPRGSLAKSLANPAALLSEMGIAPGKDQPAADGLRLGVVSPRNPLARLGLRTGDVIREFDGESVSGPADAESFLKTMSEGGEFNVLVERRGRPLRLNLSIE